MWESFAQWTYILANIATALAVAFAARQLWVLNRHARVESHLSLVQSEREIWTSALENPRLAGVIQDVWRIPGHSAEVGLFWAIFPG